MACSLCLLVRLVVPQQLVFEGAQKAGWYDPESTRVEHVGFGVVCGADKKRLRTRDGVSTKLQDLLDTARDKALAELQVRARGVGLG